MFKTILERFQKNKLPCHYALGGIDYKNGFATVCATQSDHLHTLDKTILPSKIFNSESFKQLRLDLHKGKWPSGCDMCEEVEKLNSGKSMRMDYPVNETYYNRFTGKVRFKGLNFFELRFSNSCNMACLHCSKVYSSGWMSKLKNYTPDAEDIKHKLLQLTDMEHRRAIDENLEIELSIEDVEQIVNDLNKNSPNLTKIDFAGGEVLHQKQFFPCLKLLAKHPNVKNIFLSFHSNFNTNFDPVKLSHLLKPFGRTLIHMSIDAGTNIYPYFRDGNWDTLTKNIDAFRSINNTTQLGVVCTTSAYQIMDIQNVFDSLMSLDVDVLDVAMVQTPLYLNPSIIMTKFSKDVLADIKNTYKIISQHKNINLRESARIGLNTIEHYIMKHQPKYAEDDYNSFLVYIRKTDKLWQQDFNNYLVNYRYNNNQIERVV